MIRSLLLSLLLVAPAFGQLASPSALRNYKALLPLTDDPELQEIFDNPRTLWYTHVEIPKAYQQDVAQNGQARLVSAHYKIGPDPRGFANGNGEWPWDHPAVPDNKDTRVRNLVGMLLPEGTSIAVYRVRLPRTKLSRSFQNGRLIDVRQVASHWVNQWAWKFPTGTEFVEVVTTRIGRADYAFKVLRRTKTARGETFAVYRPFNDEQLYREATGASVVDTKWQRMRDRSHDVAAVDETRNVKFVSTISPQDSIKLLETVPFKKATDESFIPTTNSNGQIWPRDYLGVFIGNGTRSSDCINCHRDVQTSVAKFESRDWYGFIRGSDSIFSFHPFDLRSISHSGGPTTIGLRPELVRAGLVRWARR